MGGFDEGGKRPSRTLARSISDELNELASSITTSDLRRVGNMCESPLVAKTGHIPRQCRVAIKKVKIVEKAKAKEVKAAAKASAKAKSKSVAKAKAKTAIKVIAKVDKKESRTLNTSRHCTLSRAHHQAYSKALKDGASKKKRGSVVDWQIIKLA